MTCLGIKQTNKPISPPKKLPTFIGSGKEKLAGTPDIFFEHEHSQMGHRAQITRHVDAKPQKERGTKTAHPC